MRELGWIEGVHYVAIEASYDGRAERIAPVVAELVARKPDVIVTGGSPTMRALMTATSTIPIVMLATADPLGQGFVASLARPGGNVTGTSSVDHGLLAKQYELLGQAVPGARRFGVLHSPALSPHQRGLRDVKAVAQRHGQQIAAVPLNAPDGIEAAFEALVRERVDAVHIFVQPFLNHGDAATNLAARALLNRWPTVMSEQSHARAGILMAYGNRIEDLVRRTAYYVDRILKGTPPGELPVEEPTRFYVTVNLKTARALGLALPPAVLARADEVIE